MIGKVSLLLLVVCLTGLSAQTDEYIAQNRQFCDMDSVDSVYNVGHLIHFIRCGEVWTYDPRMNDNAGGFLKDWSLYTLGRKHLWNDSNTEDFRMSGFSFQELNCFEYGDDLSETCYLSTRQWDHLSVLFTNHTAVTFKYTTEWEVIGTNPLGLPPGIHYLMDETSRPKFWPEFPALKPEKYDRPPNYLAALYDPHQEILFVAFKYHQILITYTRLREAIHNDVHHNKTKIMWADPYMFDGHLVGMFYDEREKTSYVVGEVLRSSRVFNDQVYPLEVSDGTKALKPGASSTDTQNTPQYLRTYFGCKYTSNESQTHKIKKRSARTKRCSAQSDFNSDQVEKEEALDKDIDFLTRVSNDPNVLFSMSILIVILSISLAHYLHLKPNP